MNIHQGCVITLQCFKVHEHGTEQTSGLTSRSSLLCVNKNLKQSRAGSPQLEKAALRDNFHLQRCNNLLGSCTQHFIFMLSVSLGNMWECSFFWQGWTNSSITFPVVMKSALKSLSSKCKSCWKCGMMCVQGVQEGSDKEI